jgi:hypothetical protein
MVHGERNKLRIAMLAGSFDQQRWIHSIIEDRRGSYDINGAGSLNSENRLVAKRH